MFRKAFEGNYSEMTQKIALSRLLWQELRDSTVLTEEQVEFCTNDQRCPTRAEKVSKMLEFLERKDDDKYGLFLQALENHDSKNVAALLREKVPPNNMTPVTSPPQQPVPPPSHNTDNVFSRKANLEEDRYPEDSFDVSLENLKPTSDAVHRKCKEQAFPMTSNPRGTVLIFNIFETSGMNDRDGTKADCDNLVKLFKKLLFNIKVYSDVSGDTGKAIPDKLKPTAENILKLTKTTLDGLSAEEQCFILVTLSHGGINKSSKEEVIYGCDGNEVTKRAILDIMADGENFPDKEIPRLVFFQCCRGANEMLREQTDCTDVRPNTLYCHSCTRDYVSYRNPVLGTRFVRALVDTFAKHAHDTDIVGLMDKVKEAMRKIDPSKLYDQIPQHIFDPIFAQKKLFFFPGISS